MVGGKWQRNRAALPPPAPCPLKLALPTTFPHCCIPWPPPTPTIARQLSHCSACAPWSLPPWSCILLCLPAPSLCLLLGLEGPGAPMFSKPWAKLWPDAELQLRVRSSGGRDTRQDSTEQRQPGWCQGGDDAGQKCWRGCRSCGRGAEQWLQLTPTLVLKSKMR